jgi:hypothetical protein
MLVLLHQHPNGGVALPSNAAGSRSREPGAKEATIAARAKTTSAKRSQDKALLKLENVSGLAR